MGELIEKMDRELRIMRPYPKKIIIAQELLNDIRSYMKDHLICGLKVNLLGDPVSLFGLKIVIDDTCTYGFRYEF